MPRPLEAVVDLAALRNNLSVARRAAAGSRVLSVVKANAYGHGLLRCAAALAEGGTDGFAILEIDNAVRLREAGLRHPLLLLEGCFDARELAVAAEHRLAVGVHDPEQIRMLDELAEGARVEVFLKINTGMNRLGLRADRFAPALQALREHRAVAGITLMTHFACADDRTGIAEQLACYRRLAEGRGLPGSLANSATVLRWPQAHGDWVRPGIMLYGGSPFADESAQSLGLEPVMTLVSRLIAVQELAAGEAVGYGATFVAPHSMRVGVVACGYADGYPRHAPTGTPVLVDGVRTRTVGRVSMDLLCVDLGPVPAAGVGSPVTLFGEGLAADEVAAAAGTISYELFCAIAPRVPTRVRAG